MERVLVTVEDEKRIWETYLEENSLRNLMNLGEQGDMFLKMTVQNIIFGEKSVIVNNQKDTLLVFEMHIRFRQEKLVLKKEERIQKDYSYEEEGEIYKETVFKVSRHNNEGIEEDAFLSDFIKGFFPDGHIMEQRIADVFLGATQCVQEHYSNKFNIRNMSNVVVTGEKDVVL